MLTAAVVASTFWFRGWPEREGGGTSASLKSKWPTPENLHRDSIILGPQNREVLVVLFGRRLNGRGRVAKSPNSSSCCSALGGDRDVKVVAY
jgi:hypothetical protein